MYKQVFEVQNVMNQDKQYKMNLKKENYFPQSKHLWANLNNSIIISQVSLCILWV